MGRRQVRMSKRCAEVRELLPWLLLDEESGEPGGQDVAAHLEECPPCAREGERLRALLGTLGGHAIPDPGEAYWQAFLPSLKSRIVSHGSRIVHWVPRFRLLALAASTASFLVVALAVSRWETPLEIRSRSALDQVVARIDPEGLQQALDAVLPGSELGPTEARRTEAIPRAADMEQALEEVFPEDDSDVYGAASDLTLKGRRGLAQSLDLDWV